MFPQTCSYRAQSVTLATGGVTYSLSALLLAIDPKFPLQGREITLCVDAATAGNIRVGESNLTAASCGYVLSTTGLTLRTYRSDKSDIPLNMIYVLGSAAAMVLDVEVVQ